MWFGFDVNLLVYSGFSNRTATGFTWQQNTPGLSTTVYTFSGTGFTYDANGYVTGGSITSMRFNSGGWLTEPGALTETVDFIGGYEASQVGDYLSQVRELSNQMSTWDFHGNGETSNPNSTTMLLSGDSGMHLRLTGTDFVAETFLGTVTLIEHLSASGAVLHSIAGTIPYRSVFASVFALFYGEDSLSHILLSGPNTITNLMPDGAPGVAVYRHEAAGIFADLQAGTAYGPQTPTDTIVNFTAIGGSAFADAIYGSSVKNSIQGNGGDDLLFGRDGDDDLYGGQGSDTLDGGSGIDTVYYDDSYSASGVNVNLFNGVAIAEGTSDQDTLLFIENVTGSTGNDFIVGNSDNNSFLGGAGNDQLWGYDGDDQLWGDIIVPRNDILVGGAGNDFLHGDNDGIPIQPQGGLDWLYGQDGEDTLYAGVTAIGSYDVLVGGNDNDQLYAGTGGYTYIYGGDGATGGGNDTMFLSYHGPSIVVMNDFEAGGANDTVRLQGTIFRSFEQIQAAMTFSGIINGTVLVLAFDMQVWFVGRQVADFTAADFLFA